MRSIIYKGIIMSKISFGSRSFILNKTQIKKIETIINKYFKMSIGIYKTSDNVLSRILFVVPPIQAMWEKNLLKQLWHLVVQRRNQDNLLWKLFSMRFINIYNKIINKYNKYKKKNGDLLLEIYTILRKFKFNKY